MSMDFVELVSHFSLVKKVLPLAFLPVLPTPRKHIAAAS